MAISTSWWAGPFAAHADWIDDYGWDTILEQSGRDGEELGKSLAKGAEEKARIQHRINEARAAFQKCALRCADKDAVARRLDEALKAKDQWYVAYEFIFFGDPKVKKGYQFLVEGATGGALDGGYPPDCGNALKRLGACTRDTVAVALKGCRADIDASRGAG